MDPYLNIEQKGIRDKKMSYGDHSQSNAVTDARNASYAILEDN